MQQFLDRSVLRVVPATPVTAPWGTPPALRTVADLAAAGSASAAVAPAAAMQREVTYNRARPSRLSWWVLCLALVLSLVAWNTGRGALDAAAGAVLFAGFVVMSWGIGTRWAVAGRIPASNMYESLLFLGWAWGCSRWSHPSSSATAS